MKISNYQSKRDIRGKCLLEKYLYNTITEEEKAEFKLLFHKETERGYNWKSLLLMPSILTVMLLVSWINAGSFNTKTYNQQLSFKSKDGNFTTIDLSSIKNLAGLTLSIDKDGNIKDAVYDDNNINLSAKDSERPACIIDLGSERTGGVPHIQVLSDADDFKGKHYNDNYHFYGAYLENIMEFIEKKYRVSVRYIREDIKNKTYTVHPYRRLKLSAMVKELRKAGIPIRWDKSVLVVG